MTSKSKHAALVVGTGEYRYLSDRVLATDPGGKYFAELKLERGKHPDGESFEILKQSLRKRDVVIIGGGASEADFQELLDLAYLAHHYHAASLRMIIPFFRYSTMERAAKPGENPKAKWRAHQLSNLPQTPGGNTVVFIDLHTEAIMHYLDATVATDQIKTDAILLPVMTETCGNHFALGCTDAGRAKQVEGLASALGAPLSIVLKKRLSNDRTREVAVNADVDGWDLILRDDMARTCSSAIGAGKANAVRGARDIYLFVTHGILPGRSLEKLESTVIEEKDLEGIPSPRASIGRRVFKGMVCTDTHPNAVRLAECNPFLQIVSVAPTIARYLLGQLDSEF